MRRTSTVSTSILTAIALGACASPPIGQLPDAASRELGRSEAIARETAPREGAVVDLAPPPPGNCAAFGSIPPTDFVLKLEHGGQTREARVRIPSSYDAKQPVGAVLNFHGYGSNAWQQSLYSDMERAAAQRGLVAVHPEGTMGAGMQSWNAGLCCGTAAATKVDDLGFVVALINALGKKVCLDPKRIYATGISNGGFMSYLLACALSDRIAAVAPVAAVNLTSPCTPKRPVPLLHFHGTDDTLVAYKGNAALGWPGALSSVQGIASLDGCGGAPKPGYSQGEVSCQVWSGCQGGAEARLCTVQGGGHTWPGGVDLPIPWIGHMTKDINATETMLDFFLAHPMP